MQKPTTFVEFQNNTRYEPHMNINFNIFSTNNTCTSIYIHKPKDNR